MAMKIGEKIRTLRKANNMSQEALAELLGVTFQAVSKWETNTALPDLSLIPSIASFFGVSIDELFDYNTRENEQRIDRLCREAVSCRDDDPVRAEEILREGLRQFPANDTILAVLMYILNSVPDRSGDQMEVCRQLIDHSTNEGVKCDALRTLAVIYHDMGEFEQVKRLLEQIPEFYFTKLECLARLTEGEQSLDAARLQMNLSGKSLVDMLNIMNEHFGGMGNQKEAERCARIAEGVLHVFRREGGKALEVPGYEWVGA